MEYLIKSFFRKPDCFDDTEQLEKERREAEQREVERREAERREAERREAERREAERREAEQREAEQRKAERDEGERRRAERSKMIRQRALDECKTLKDSYGASFSYFDEITHLSGDFTTAPKNVSLEMIGNPMRRNLRYRDICESFSKPTTYKLKFLPPIVFQFHLSGVYPVDPRFVFRLACPWFSAEVRTELNNTLTELISQNHGNTLTLCCNFLKNDALSKCFPSREDGTLWFNLIEAFPDGDIQLTTEILIDYEEEQRDIEFKSQTFNCPVCREEFPGTDCIRLKACGHILCRNCIEAYLNTQIENGTNGGNPTCFACNGNVHQQEILHIVSPEKYAKYEERLLNQALSSMHDI